jgi:N-acetylglucosamine kinase-like BadF-type ATPase
LTNMPPTTDGVRNRPESTANELILALDAGGTKTAAWLVETNRDKPRIVGRGRAASGNPLSVGFDGAASAIAEAVSLARGAANREQAPISRAVLSIAGTLDSEVRRQFTAWANEQELALQITVVPDFLPVLAAGTPHCSGVALIAGTGSAAFARSPGGRTCLCGGWGYLLGDEGSGYAIGRAALRGALDERELDKTSSDLSAKLLHRFNVDSVRELTRAVYRSPDPRATIASTAALVLETADSGDPFAVAIVDEAARDLAALAARSANAVELGAGPIALAVTGGVLVSSARMRSQLLRELQNSGTSAVLNVVAEPLDGCLRLADPELSDVVLEWR